MVVSTCIHFLANDVILLIMTEKFYYIQIKFFFNLLIYSSEFVLLGWFCNLAIVNSVIININALMCYYLYDLLTLSLRSYFVSVCVGV